ncbi:MAG: hypothetical protein RLN60_02170 [Phycisphaerales bacterium]
MTRVGTITLTARDRALIELLSVRVRVLSLDQVAARFWPEAGQGRRLAGNRLTKLASAGLVTVQERVTRTMLNLQQPLAIWRPHRPPPDFAHLARTLATRWPDGAARTACVTVTEGGAQGVAGIRASTPPADSEVSHDLHLTEVYFRMQDELPARASTWILETHLPKGQGVKVPDAIVRDGLDRTAIEFGGLYDRAKLEAFHDYCRGKRMGYELW